MIKKALILIAIAIVSYLTYSCVDGNRKHDRAVHEFTHPSRDSVVAELSHNLSVEISDETKIILAYRNEPHPFFAEYSGCLIISVGNDDRQKFLDAFEGADPKSSSMECPNNDAFYVKLKEYRLDFIGRLKPEIDESYQLWIADDDKTLLLMTSVS